MESDPPARSSRAFVPVLAAAGISGVAGYVVLVLATRALERADAAQFLVFWSVLFAIFGVLIGVTTETTRAVFSTRDAAGATTRIMPVALGLGAALVTVVGVSSPLWAARQLGTAWPGLLAAILVGIALFVVHCTLGGIAAGRGEWGSYGTLVGLESVMRLGLCGAAVALGAQVVGLAWAVAGACGTWILLSTLSGRQRHLWGARTTATPRGLLRRFLTSCTASGVSALMLVGYPMLVKATTDDVVFSRSAPLILAISLCRAPLLVPLGAYQNVVVTKVVTHGIRALVPVVAGVAVLTLLGAAVAWPVGPWALRLVNPDYIVDGPVFTGLVLGAGMVSVLYLTGAAAVALDHHTVYLVGWIAATVAAVVVLATPWSLETRVVTSLLVGPAVGVLVHTGLGRQRIS
ncbi:conserved membrane hypothetical protein [metagenome]|uniref:Polysaccharide biosynthesis protein n=1 Tax=metagenome TaxID=256318 RepID=A0A2P2C1J4_9ZZZZ